MATPQPPAGPPLAPPALARPLLVAMLLLNLVTLALVWPRAALWAYDDPFITYRYALNLAGGAGFVFNIGEHVLSTTTPLYTLLLALVALAGWPLPLVSNLIGVLAIGGSSLITAALLPAASGWAARLCAFLLVLLLPSSYVTLGSEIPLYTLLILATIMACERRRPVWAGVWASLAALIRPDGALILVIALAWFALRERRLPLRTGVTALALLTPWYLFALLYFGSLFPVTLTVKQAQFAQIEASQSFPELLAFVLGGYLMRPLFLGATLAMLVGLAALLIRRPPALLMIWAASYTLAYTLLGVAAYYWYAVPLVPAFVWLIAYGTDLSGRALQRWLRPARPWLATVIVLVLLAPALVDTGLNLNRTLARAPEPRALIYRQAGEWLARETLPHEQVGLLEVGIIGYYSQRPVVDFAGLIQPDVAQAPGRSYTDWAIYAIQAYQPEVVILPPALHAALAPQPWFQAYTQVAEFTQPGYEPGPLRAFRRR